MDTEIWKDIPWYEWKYQASSLGRVRNTKSYHILSQYLTWEYLQVCFSKKTTRVHRLIALTFIPNPEKKRYINHIDGNKLNNKANNLEWVTASENLKHTYDIWLFNQKKWKMNIRSIRVNQYSIEGYFIREWEWMKQIEREAWYNHGNISLCCSWKIKRAYWFIWKYWGLR